MPLSLPASLRHTARAFRRSPWFVLGTVGTLSLGVGAATAGFAVYSLVTLRPLPGVANADRLGQVMFGIPATSGGVSVMGISTADRDRIMTMSPAVEALAGFQRSTVNVTDDAGVLTSISALFVMDGYFSTLGASPGIGRAFGARDNAAPAGEQVAIISDALWRGRFAGRPDILGQTLRVSKLPFVIVGVMPPGFHGSDLLPNHGELPEVWFPSRTYFDVNHFRTSNRPADYETYEFVVRRTKAATFELVSAQLNAATAVVKEPDGPNGEHVSALTSAGIGLEPNGRQNLLDSLVELLGITLLLLLAALANVANLRLIRQVDRRSEIATRLVLGASPHDLLAEHLLDALVTGVISAIGGLAFAAGALKLFGSSTYLNIPLADVPIDWRVVVFAALAGVLASLLASLIPTLIATRGDLSARIRAAGPTRVRGLSVLHSLFGTAQVIVGLVLLAGTLLFVRSAREQAKVPVGFSPSGLTTFGIEPATDGGLTHPQTGAYLRALRDRLTAIPGVTGVAFTEFPPLTGGTFVDGVGPVGTEPDADRNRVIDVVASANLLSVLKVPIVAGTTFVPADEAPGNRKVVISQSVARKYFGDRNPVGERIVRAHPKGTTLEIIGVAHDVTWQKWRYATDDIIYEALDFDRADQMGIIIDSRVPEAELGRMVAAAAREVNPDVPVSPRGTMKDALAERSQGSVFMVKFIGGLGLLTLLLTIAGLYSVISYQVTARIREFGIRIALGASSTTIQRTAIQPAFVILVLGIVGGVDGGLYLTGFIAKRLYQVDQFDPFSFSVATLSLTAVVLLASWIPARRATRIDPMVALRSE